jgi:hypothetical protein
MVADVLVRWAEAKMVGGVSEVTLLTPIRPGPIPGEGRSYEQRLRQELASVQQRVARGMPTPVGRISTIHFARWLILRPEQYLQLSACFAPFVAGAASGKADPGQYRSWLFFTSNFDGDLKSYLRDFAVFLAADVDRIWSNCEGYPASGAKDFEAYWSYAKRYQIPTDAFYNAYPGLSVARIHQLSFFKQHFDAFVARTRGPDGRSVANLAELFDEFLERNSAYTRDFPTSGGLFPDARRSAAGAK